MIVLLSSILTKARGSWITPVFENGLPGLVYLNIDNNEVKIRRYLNGRLSSAEVLTDIRIIGEKILIGGRYSICDAGEGHLLWAEYRENNPDCPFRVQTFSRQIKNPLVA